MRVPNSRPEDPCTRSLSKHDLSRRPCFVSVLTIDFSRDVTPLMRAAYANHTATVCLLAKLGADVEACDSGGSTALSHAASNQYADTMVTLLKCGANVDASDNKGYTALHHAAAAGHRDIARMLVEAKADIERRDDSGRTPWMIALHVNKDAGLRTLLEPDPEKAKFLRELQRDRHAADIAKHMNMIYR